MSAVVVVQRLVTRWEKSGRGHPAASRRAKLPTALELPRSLFDGPVVYHSVTFDQGLDFEPRVTHAETRTTHPQHDCGLSLTLGGNRLVASFQWEQDCGAPRRIAGVPTSLFELGLGEFGRLIHNGRFTPEYSWTYQQVIVNIGLLAAPTTSWFVDSEPNLVADLRADLW